jgi:putative hydrolase of the HAD superfamily
MPHLTHLLFDFFGTLVEYSESRTEQGYECSHKVLVSNGANLGYQEFLERWSAVCCEFDLRAEASQDEYSMDQVVTEFLSRALTSQPSADLVDSFRDTYLREWNKGVKYIEGVAELLSDLAQWYTLALVTNTHSAEFVQAHLRTMGVEDYFSAIVTSVEYGKRKPCAAIFQHALNVTRGESQSAVYVGDSFAADYLGARGIGMRCLLIDPLAKQDVPAADRLTHILDVRQVLFEEEQSRYKRDLP